MSRPRVLRVGGVPEPFNLPWVRAFADNAFAHLGVEVTFTEYAGGTGALVEALENESIDLATVLTEGGVTAIANGANLRMHSAWTLSPLTWGIHVAADSDLASIDDLEGQRFAISRYGSGSELMAYVLADQQQWNLTEENFVPVGGLDGAAAALPAGDAEIFLWERFVTASLVNRGIFREIGDLLTPWPAFYVAARPTLLEHNRPLIDGVVQVALAYGNSLEVAGDEAVEHVVANYGMTDADSRTWMSEVDWPDTPAVDLDVLRSTLATMFKLGRVAAPVPTDKLVG